ncbi:LodA/GoxA family CTQ-dependent oxidase [Mesorhizobium sp. M0227]|uniref:LodA/GoxA family CTQ-dependent oxidase n=1 Tax=Mesorhizobium sp. M0227 TaxID=2956922 RepID=UPI0033369B1A
MPRYKIFPAIGIARLGEDQDFFLGPEIPGGGPTEAATGAPVTRFKNADKTRLRKQGARFHLFESEDGVTWTPANLPPSATVEWSVTLENKKSAIVRPPNPPIKSTRPALDAAAAGMHIKGGTKSVAGASAIGPTLAGMFKTTANGSAFEVPVELGSLRTDANGMLILLGGNGISGAPPGTPIGGSYYRNPKWYDDVSDGPVTAKISIGAGDAPVYAEGGAWVVVAPPDYAPGIGGIVTLYDVIRQVGIDQLGLAPPAAVPSFDLDILPLIQRARRYRWVQDEATWQDPSFEDPKLRSRSISDQPLRATVQALILKAEKLLEGHTDPAGPKFEIRQAQKSNLAAWVAGNFDDTPTSHGPTPTANGLTRAALEGAVGQGFCPGIEAGIIVLDTTLYTSPFDFRIDQSTVAAGDLTALMAQPWQADFLKCNTNWWPSQRPDTAFQDHDNYKNWVRGASKHSLLVERFPRLGFIVQDGANEVFLEAERDPAMPNTP